MQENVRPTGSLPVILIAAVVQGWLLYWLHRSVVEEHWPATAPGWLFALYGLALFVPLTVQMLSGFARRIDMWVGVAAIGVAYALFGWHFGSWVAVDDGPARFLGDSSVPALGIESAVLWLLLLPFVQARLIADRWNAHYPTLFSVAWHNTLVLAEAVLFTALFWLLLGLCAVLFHMLGIDFFRDLFREPIFIYPVTAITFGIALHLIGSIDRLTSVVLEQVLNVLKWLALVAGIILVMFTLALVAKLPGLIGSGERAIGAAWLLWLVAVIVLLLNAAYRDGSVNQPYPRFVAQGLRWAVPLTVIVALTAVYAMFVRTSNYGLTVERVWAWIVASAAAMYAIGYSISVFDRSGWLPRIARVNVIVALVLIATIALSLTPILSPYRLAANSQLERALTVAEPPSLNEGRYGWRSNDTAFTYLRFNAGRYGVDRLNRLAAMKDGPEAERVSKAAQEALDREHRWDQPRVPDPDAALASMLVFPEGYAAESALLAALRAALMERQTTALAASVAQVRPAGIFIDLNADGDDEFVLLTQRAGITFERQPSGEWSKVGVFFQTDQSWENTLQALDRGDYKAVPPEWASLQIGRRQIRVVPAD